MHAHRGIIRNALTVAILFIGSFSAAEAVTSADVSQTSCVQINGQAYCVRDGIPADGLTCVVIDGETYCEGVDGGTCVFYDGKEYCRP